MSQRLELALRRFEQIRPARGEAVSSAKAEELTLWLEQDVCRVVQELSRRSDFRAHVRWPIDQLQSGATGVARALVKAIDEAIVDLARSLAEVARQPAMQKAMLLHGPDSECLANDDSRGQRVTSSCPGGSSVPDGLSIIDHIAQRPWLDLVALDDFFGSVAELNLKDASLPHGSDFRFIRIAEFMPYLNPRLRHPGDYVSQTLLIRIEHWKRILTRFYVRCQKELANSTPNSGGAWERVLEHLSTLNENHSRLRDLCIACEDARLRDSCIALTLVLAGSWSGSDLSWLGLPTRLLRNAVDIPYRVKHQYDTGVPERIAAALLDVAPLVQNVNPIDPETEIEKKCQTHELVVVMGPGRREVYWRRLRIDVDWFKRQSSWNLLSSLVESARIGVGTDVVDLDGRAVESPKERAVCSLKDARHRLKDLIPDSLDQRIKPSGRGTYKLDLPRERVCLLQFEQVDFLAEAGTAKSTRRRNLSQLSGCRQERGR